MSQIPCTFPKTSHLNWQELNFLFISCLFALFVAMWHIIACPSPHVKITEFKYRPQANYKTRRYRAFVTAIHAFEV